MINHLQHIEPLFFIIGTFGLSGTAFAALIVSAMGAGTAIYGADQQRKNNNTAIDANAALQDKTNQSAWASYLLSRGLNPAGSSTGVIPTNAQATNTRLPLWANVTRGGGAAKGFRLGANSGGGPRLALGGGSFNQPAAADSAGSPVAGNGEKSTIDKLRPDNLFVTVTNPLDIGGKDKTWYDPLGIF